MALKIFYDKDADLGRLDGKTVAILGYGSQGHAHALNLKASGVDVVVGLRKDSPTVGKAERSGLRVLGVSEAAAEADITMMTLPDESMARSTASTSRRTCSRASTSPSRTASTSTSA